jgi:transcriptional regulatory protein RtcR
MATLADGGRITENILEDEIVRLKYDWSGYEPEVGKQSNSLATLREVLSEEVIAEIDLFDHAQLAEVIKVCRGSKTMADAGRKLFNVSRTKRTTSKDSHRLKVYLQKFGLEFRGLGVGD